MFFGLVLRGSSLTEHLSDSVLCWATGELNGDIRPLLSRTERDEALRDPDNEKALMETADADPAPETVAVTAPAAIAKSWSFLALGPCGVAHSSKM